MRLAIPAVLLLWACGAGDGDAASSGDDCSARVPLDGAAFACAVRPSATDPRISDDFGLHAIAFPGDVGRDTPVYLHFVGTNGTPARADGTLTNLPILGEGAAHGYLVIILAYSDDQALLSLCAEDVDCYEPVRWEIVTGEDARRPYSDKKRVVAPDDSDSRLRALVAWLAARGPVRELPAALAGPQIDWSRMRVGGHSQGGGQAGVIALRREVARACMFASPVDASSSLRPAAWILEDWATPLERRRVLVHVDDPFHPKIAANAGAMHMTADEYRELVGETSAPHLFGIDSETEEAKRGRAWACFE